VTYIREAINRWSSLTSSNPCSNALVITVQVITVHEKSPDTVLDSEDSLQVLVIGIPVTQRN